MYLVDVQYMFDERLNEQMNRWMKRELAALRKLVVCSI